MTTAKKLSKELIVNTICLTLLSGVSLSSGLVSFSLFGILVPLTLILWVWHYRHSFNRLLIVVMMAAGIFGVLIMLLQVRIWKMTTPPSLPTRWQATVVGFPDINGINQKILARTNGFLVELKLPSYQQLEPADQISWYGQLISVKEDMKSRNLWGFYFRQSIQAITKKPPVVSLLPKRSFDLWPEILRGIFFVRTRLNDIFKANLVEPSASLIAGILIGDRGNLSAQVIDDFQKTGLTHILAISGFNITIIINFIVLFAASSGKRWSLFGSIVLVSVFVLLTGASASVVRAGVMGLLAMSVKVAGRKLAPLKLILISTTGIVLFNPATLNFDLSFQLSLVATMSLIFFSGNFEIAGLKGWRDWVWEGVSLTLAAQVLTLPIIFFGFGKISLVSPLANLLVGPIIPILMILGTILVGLNLFFPYLTLVLSGAIGLLVNLMLWVVETLAKLPLSQVEFGKGEVWLALVYYLLVFRFFRKRRLERN